MLRGNLRSKRRIEGYTRKLYHWEQENVTSQTTTVILIPSRGVQIKQQDIFSIQEEGANKYMPHNFISRAL